eukprot:73884-Amphidinium_carterae.1
MVMHLPTLWWFVVAAMTLRSWVCCLAAQPTDLDHTCSYPCMMESAPRDSPADLGSDSSSLQSLLARLVSWCLWAAPSLFGSAPWPPLPTQEFIDLCNEALQYVSECWYGSGEQETEGDYGVVAENYAWQGYGQEYHEYGYGYYGYAY